jgi:hypothetical protein
MNLGFEGYVPPEKSVSEEGARSQNPGVRSVRGVNTHELLGMAPLVASLTFGPGFTIAPRHSDQPRVSWLLDSGS